MGFGLGLGAGLKALTAARPANERSRIAPAGGPEQNVLLAESAPNAYCDTDSQ